jgi:hypothetical protein
MSAWKDIVRTLTRNPISTFAVLCVAATSVLLGVLVFRLLAVLESPDWCSKMLQAERISGEGFGGLTACVEFGKIQLGALSTALHISNGGFVFVLIVLVVVVIAGARASGKVGPTGVDFNIGSDAKATDAAQFVADQGQAAADEVKDAAPDVPKVPDYAK